MYTKNGWAPTVATAFIVFSTNCYADLTDQNKVLEEIIVTATKREGLLQQTPVAISVLQEKEIEFLNINGLEALREGLIPSLKILPLGNTPSTMVMAIRGNGPTDVSQVTRESSVAVYLDGVYLGRPQGLGMELADLERIEVLRGPQGTLFGRNATGGAVSMVSKKPTGKFGVKQILSGGRYDSLKSVTRINFPELAEGLKAKLDYVYSEGDGWVKNSAAGAADFNEYVKDGGRFRLDWERESIFVSYSFDATSTETAQNYFQLYKDYVGLIGVERERETHTRFPIAPLEPTDTDQLSHTLIADWKITDYFELKSISGYRLLDERTNNNYGGTLYVNGFIDALDIDQSQFSQELQLTGTIGTVEWVSGVFYFNENAKQTVNNYYSIDIAGCVSSEPFSPVPLTDELTLCKPVVPIDNLVIPPGNQRAVDTDAESYAAYGQLTWHINEDFHVTTGIRYTQDKKSGVRIFNDTRPFKLDNDYMDPQLTLGYDINENTYAYIKWATAHKAGGVNLRSFLFSPYDEEKAETLELGFKSQFWSDRFRLNASAFKTNYTDMQMDFANPNDIASSETINARRKVEVDGLELDITAVPFPGLVVALAYTYLDDTIPLQPNPLSGEVEKFFVTQSPKHAGSLSVDYQFKPWRIGTLTAHLDITSTDSFSYVPFGEQRYDTYSLINGRLTLADIEFSEHNKFNLSVWGKNLSDEQYIVYAFSVAGASLPQAFGTPRTAGVDITFEF